MTALPMTQQTPAPAAARRSTSRRRPYYEVIGVPLNGATNLDDALRMAGLNWDLIVTDLGSAMTVSLPGSGESVVTSAPERRLVLRDDTHTILGMVGTRYEAVPNSQALGVSEALVEEGAAWVAAIERDHGRSVYMIVRPSAGIVRLTDKHGSTEEIDVLVQIKAGHAGKGSVDYDMRAVRRINHVPVGAMFSTTDIADIDGVMDPKIKVRHTKNAADRIEDARSILRSNLRYTNGFTTLAQRLVETPLSRQQFAAVISTLWAVPTPPSIPVGTSAAAIKKITARFQSQMEAYNRRLADCMALWDAEPFAPRTAYSAYVAISEFLEFEVKGRGRAQDESSAQRTLQDENATKRSRLISSLVRADRL